MIRRATHDDMDFLMSLAVEMYPPFDVEMARTWLTGALGNENVMILRSESGAIVAAAARQFWTPIISCHMLFLCARSNRGLDAYRLIKAMDEWRKSIGAEVLHFGSDTDVDFSPFAKRLGATQFTKAFSLH